ncbi:MAG TPA: hypothetical protein VGT05_01585 [Patescibacteria group bacterium]|nr:hypothetical protein [Patescibacteria group bacterium]
MKEELKRSLREMQANPTTGTPHNQHVISTQVETIFMLDDLLTKIKKLNSTIESSNRQSQKLEQSNYRLQIVMLVLTAISAGVAVYPFLKVLFNSASASISSLLMHLTHFTLISQDIVTILSTIGALIFSLITFFVEKRITKSIVLRDHINLKETMTAILRDKDGNIKEVIKQ